MRRIMVIGCPGSGKSRFSRILAERLGLPLVHLDLLYWKPDRTTVEKTVFRARLAEEISKDEWIIDGNYGSTLELRFAACDTVIFFDFPTELCLLGLRERFGKPRPDMPWVETEEDGEFVKFVREFREVSRPRILSMLERAGERQVITMTSREEADRFLDTFS